MDKESKIFIAGHRGLVGSAILYALEAKNYSIFVLRSSWELDLRNQQAVSDFFCKTEVSTCFFSCCKSWTYFS